MMATTSGGSILSKLEISKKIVGRDDEIERLQEIYCKIRDEAPTQPPHNCTRSSKRSRRSPSVFVKGVSGVGKSVLVEAAFAEMVETDDHGYYVEGKFDLRSLHLPFSAVAAALESLCSKAFRDDDGGKDKGASLRQNIEEAFDIDDQAVLAGLLPNLLVTGDDDISSGPRSNHVDGRKHLNNLFRLKKLIVPLVRLIVGDRVLVMFIDDLQVSSKTTGDESTFKDIQPNSFYSVYTLIGCKSGLM
jgi:predicted ATPase